MKPLLKYLFASSLLLLSTGCITSGVIDGVEQKAAEIRNGPQQLPQRNMTDFRQSLRCMDNMFLSFGVGRGDYALMVEELDDKTKKVDAGTRQMMISTISEMTKRSGALRLVTYGADAGNLISFMNEAGKKGVYDDIPAFDIIGSISQYDDGVFRKQADNSAEVAGTNDGSSLGLGGGRSASSSVTFMTIDLGIITSHDLSIVPGVNAKNTVELYNRGSSSSFDGGISKTGMSYSFSSSSKDAVGQALRALVELSTIELVGKLTKLPYWNCLGMDSNHPEIKHEISDWFFQLSQMGILHRTLKLQLTLRGYYSGPIDEELSEDYLLAILEYRQRLGLPPIPAIDLEFYTEFLHHTPISEQPESLAYVKKASQLNSKSGKREPVLPTVKPITLALTPLNESNIYELGQEVFVKVETNTNGYMNCYFQRDEVFVRVFPNRFSADGYISSKGGIMLPDSEYYSLIADNSLEQIHCFLATSMIDNDLPAQLQIPDLEQLPIYSVDQIKEAYSKITNNRFGMATFDIQTQ